MEESLYQEMEKWPRHIYGFEPQYAKAFAGQRLFRAYITDRIHKQVKVFLHSCNTMSLEDVETGELAEFEELQRQAERGGCINPPPPPG